MRITTKLQLNVTFSVCAIFLIGLSAWMAFTHITQAFTTNARIERVVVSSFELHIITTEYLLTFSKRAEQQWLRKHNAISDLVQTLQIENNEQQVLIQDLHRNRHDMKTVFTLMISMLANSTNDNLRTAQLRTTLINQLLLKSQNLFVRAEQLHKVSQANLIALLQEVFIAIFILALVIHLGMIISANIIKNAVGKPIHKLLNGVRTVGSGQLDTRVATNANDEIGELSRTFDEMTTNLAIITVSTDKLLTEIQERKRIEAALHCQEDRYRGLFENMSSGVAIYKAIDNGQDFVVIDFNKASERIEKINREQVIGRSILSVFPGVKACGFFDTLFRVYKSNVGQHLPVFQYTDNRISGWRKNYVYKLPANEIVAIYDDVSKQQLAEQALINSEEKYRSLYETSLYGITFIAFNGYFEQVNPAFQKMLGYDRKTFQSLTYQQITPPKWTTMEVKIVAEQVMKHGTSDEYEKEFICSDGSVIPAMVQLWLMHDAQGKPIRMLGMVRDISAQKQLLCLAQEKALAQAENTAKSAFLAAMSHDIRTPLNAVLGMTEVLQDTVLTEEQRNYLDVISRAGKGLLALINDILDLSKIEAGQLLLEKSVFDIYDFTKKTIAILTDSAQKKGIPIELVFSERLPQYVCADDQRLRQVFLNLLHNAIKFTTQGRIIFSIIQTIDDGIIFSVADTGIGIPEDKLENIFHPFTQADITTTKRFGGNGLGLSICQKLISIMGGHIWVESVVGKGSHFQFTVPISTDSKNPVLIESSAVHEQSIASNSTVMHILLAEDVDMNADVVQAVLKDTPHHLDIAKNGVQAFDKYCNGSYNLILMDIEMPLMDGITATRHIRTWEKTHGKSPIPIVALTAHAIKEVQEKTLAAGCNIHMTKPISKQRLLKLIQQFSDN